MSFVRYTQFIVFFAVSGILLVGSHFVWSQLSREINIKFPEKLFVNVAQTYDQPAVLRTKEWQNLIENNRNAALEDQLYAVNTFFNKIPFADDILAWGVDDYWATPYEFLGINAGDCEDFTIAKYITLRELGIEDEQLRMMYVTMRNPRRAHMVLAYYPQKKSIPLVLDNFNKRILPASQRRDLIPLYSFNGEGLWLAREQGQGRKIHQHSNNKLWDDLHERLHEKF